VDVKDDQMPKFFLSISIEIEMKTRTFIGRVLLTFYPTYSVNQIPFVADVGK